MQYYIYICKYICEILHVCILIGLLDAAKRTVSSDPGAKALCPKGQAPRPAPRYSSNHRVVRHGVLERWRVRTSGHTVDGCEIRITS